MDIKVKCPKCRGEVSGKPLKTWRYRQFEVGRYECHSCNSKFNFYQSPRSAYTIPKAK